MLVCTCEGAFGTLEEGERASDNIKVWVIHAEAHLFVPFPNNDVRRHDGRSSDARSSDISPARFSDDIVMKPS